MLTDRFVLIRAPVYLQSGGRDIKENHAYAFPYTGQSSLFLHLSMR